MVSSIIRKYIGSEIFSNIKLMQWAVQRDQKKVPYLCCKAFLIALNAYSLSLINWTIFFYPTSLTTSSNISNNVPLSFRRPGVSSDFKNMVPLGEQARKFIIGTFLLFDHPYAKWRIHKVSNQL